MRRERLQMCRDGAARGKIAAWLRQPRRSTAREQRTEQEHRAAKLSDQRRIGPVGRDRRASDPQRRGADARDRRTKTSQQLRRGPRRHESGARSSSTHSSLAEQAGGEKRQRRVLVAFDRDLAYEPPSAFDLQRRHRSAPSAVTASPAARRTRSRRSLREGRRRSGPDLSLAACDQPPESRPPSPRPR